MGIVQSVLQPSDFHQALAGSLRRQKRQPGKSQSLLASSVGSVLAGGSGCPPLLYEKRGEAVVGSGHPAARLLRAPGALSPKGAACPGPAEGVPPSSAPASREIQSKTTKC